MDRDLEQPARVDDYLNDTSFGYESKIEYFAAQPAVSQYGHLPKNLDVHKPTYSKESLGKYSNMGSGSVDLAKDVATARESSSLHASDILRSIQRWRAKPRASDVVCIRPDEGEFGYYVRERGGKIAMQAIPVRTNLRKDGTCRGSKD
jgi:hypothetical protein